VRARSLITMLNTDMPGILIWYPNAGSNRLFSLVYCLLNHLSESIISCQGVHWFVVVVVCMCPMESAPLLVAIPSRRPCLRCSSSRCRIGTPEWSFLMRVFGGWVLRLAASHASRRRQPVLLSRTHIVDALVAKPHNWNHLGTQLCACRLP